MGHPTPNCRSGRGYSPWAPPWLLGPEPQTSEKTQLWPLRPFPALLRSSMRGAGSAPPLGLCQKHFLDDWLVVPLQLCFKGLWGPSPPPGCLLVSRTQSMSEHRLAFTVALGRATATGTVMLSDCSAELNQGGAKGQTSEGWARQAQAGPLTLRPKVVKHWGLPETQGL